MRCPETVLGSSLPGTRMCIAVTDLLLLLEAAALFAHCDVRFAASPPDLNQQVNGGTRLLRLRNDKAVAYVVPLSILRTPTCRPSPLPSRSKPLVFVIISNLPAVGF